MLPTEVQRIVLLIGLAATGYLMILAWNDDYMQSGTPSEYSAAPELQDLREPVAPEAPPAGAVGAAETDVPDASLIAGQRPSAAPVAGSQPASEDRLIRVSTPQGIYFIDRLGGDIVRVELPQYPVAIDRPDLPFVLLDSANGRTYIAQSGLMGADGIDAGGQRPMYDTVAGNLEMGDDDDLSLVLKTELKGLRVEKVYEFRRGDYLVDMRYRVSNENPAPISASLFAQIKRGTHEPAGSDSFSLGPQPYLGAALTTADERYKKLEFDDLDEGNFTEIVAGGWIAFLQHYFLSAWVAQSDEQNNFYGTRRADGTYTFGYTGPLQTIAAGATGEWRSRFYAGPKDQLRLEQISENLNLTIDYGFLWWLAVPLFHLLDWLHAIYGNWGVAIIALTVLVKLVLYPLSAASYRSMANMRRVGPQMKRLQERYADDRQKLSQEMMALYKKEKVNPLGGCLPMLLPMPIFIALYWVLFESVELRQAPFFLWIDDLAAMDPYFILPLLMGASMYYQMTLSPPVGDPMQARMMKMMPIMFTVLFLFFPSGLVLYWLVNNLLGIAQQWYVMRQVDNAQVSKN